MPPPEAYGLQLAPAARSPAAKGPPQLPQYVPTFYGHPPSPYDSY